MAIGGGGNVGGANFEITASEGKPSVEDILKGIDSAVKKSADDLNKAFESALAASEKFAQTKGGVLIPQSALDDLKTAEASLDRLSEKIEATGQSLPGLNVNALRDSLRDVEEELSLLDAEAQTVGNVLSRALTGGISSEPVDELQTKLSGLNADALTTSLASVPEAFKRLDEEVQHSVAGLHTAEESLERMEAEAEAVGRALAQALTGAVSAEGFEKVEESLRGLEVGEGLKESFDEAGDAASGMGEKFEAALKAGKDTTGQIEAGLTGIIKKFNEMARQGEIVTGAVQFEKITGEINKLEAAARTTEQAFTRVGKLPPLDVTAYIASLRDAAEQGRAILGRSPLTGKELVPDLAPAERKFRDLARLQEQAIRENQKFDESLKIKNAGLRELTASERKLQAYQKVVERATADNVKFDESARLKNLGLPQVAAGEAKVRSYVKTVDSALRKNEELNRKSGIKILDPKQVDLAIAELKKLEALLKSLEESLKRRGPSKVTEARVAEVKNEILGLNKALQVVGKGASFDDIAIAAEKAKAPTTGLQRVISGLNEKLAGMGLSVSSISVLLGAGFAGGLAGIAKITLDLGQKLADFIGREIELERQTDLSFGAASSDIKEFARSAASDFGSTREELLELTNAFKAFIDSLDFTLPADTHVQLTESLAELAVELEKIRPGFEGVGDVEKAITAAATGSDEALRKLGVSVKEFRDISLETFGKRADLLTDAERFKAVIIAISAEIAKELERSGEKTKSVWKRSWDAIRRDFQQTIDLFRTTPEERFDKLVASLNELNSGSITAAESLQHFNSLKFGGLDPAELNFLRIQAKGHRDIIALIDKEIAARKKHADAIRDTGQAAAALIAQQKIAEEQFLDNTSAINSATDSFKNLRRTEEAGVRAIANANRELARTREDVLQKAIDLSVELARAEEDANIRIVRARLEQTDVIEQNRQKIQEAGQRLADAIEAQRRQREDSENKLDDLRKKIFRSERDAVENLADLRFDHERKQSDLRRRVKQAQDQAVKDFTEAQISIETAMRKGDAEAEASARRNLARLLADKSGQSSLSDAKRELAREQEDFKRKEKRLERDLAELRKDNIEALDRAEKERTRAQVDAAKAVQRAEEELHKARFEAGRDLRKAEEQLADARREAQREHEDAIRALNRLEIENNRALFDAQRNIANAERELSHAIETAITAIQRMAKELGITVTRLRELVDTLNFQRSFVAGPLPPGFAAGGPFDGPFIAGERGPELIIPEGGGSGQVVNNDDFMALLRALADDRKRKNLPPIIVNEVANDPEATAAAVANRLTRSLN